MPNTLDASERSALLRLRAFLGVCFVLLCLFWIVVLYSAFLPDLAYTSHALFAVFVLVVLVVYGGRTSFFTERCRQTIMLYKLFVIVYLSSPT